MKSKGVYVQIMQIRGDQCVQQMGPHSEREAEQICDGVAINLNRREYYVTTSPKKLKVHE